jgi:hypothetical protein
MYPTTQSLTKQINKHPKRALLKPALLKIYHVDDRKPTCRFVTFACWRLVRFPIFCLNRCFACAANESSEGKLPITLTLTV